MTLLLVHIVAGLAAITAGAVALSAAKGGTLHRRAGRWFVLAMLVMTGVAVVLAASKLATAEVMTPLIRLQWINLVAGPFTAYLVVTSLLTVKYRDRPSWIDRAATVVAAIAAMIAFWFAYDSATGPKGKLLGFPAMPSLIFGTVALLAILGDIRLMRGRVLDGRHRIARHLWRMCFAMFVATGSFFLGQAKVFPQEIRTLPVLATPVLAVLACMLFWWVRVLVMKRLPRGARAESNDRGEPRQRVESLSGRGIA